MNESNESDEETNKPSPDKPVALKKPPGKGNIYYGGNIDGVRTGHGVLKREDDSIIYEG